MGANTWGRDADGHFRFWATLPSPGASGGTIRMRGAFGVCTVSHSATYTLIDSPPGTELLIPCSNTSVVTIADSTGVIGSFVGTNGTTAARCTATDSNSWGMEIISSDRTTGFIDLPLTSWREVATNDIINASGNGGVLATDTTPALEYVNGDTNSTIQVLWAATNADPIARQITLPPDLDRTANITLNIQAAMGGDSDFPVIDIDSFFHSPTIGASVKIEDATATLTSSNAIYAATIAAADIPDTANSMSVELTPGTHGSDTIAVFAIWLTYSKKAR